MAFGKNVAFELEKNLHKTVVKWGTPRGYTSTKACIQGMIRSFAEFEETLEEERAKNEETDP